MVNIVGVIRESPLLPSSWTTIDHRFPHANHRTDWRSSSQFATIAPSTICRKSATPISHFDRLLFGQLPSCTHVRISKNIITCADKDDWLLSSTPQETISVPPNTRTTSTCQKSAKGGMVTNDTKTGLFSELRLFGSKRVSRGCNRIVLSSET